MWSELFGKDTAQISPPMVILSETGLQTSLVELVTVVARRRGIARDNDGQTGAAERPGEGEAASCEV